MSVFEAFEPGGIENLIENIKKYHETHSSPGGSSGPMWLEVDANGDLYAYYDDLTSAPNLEFDEESGNLYAIFETEVA